MLYSKEGRMCGVGVGSLSVRVVNKEIETGAGGGGAVRVVRNLAMPLLWGRRGQVWER